MSDLEAKLTVMVTEAGALRRGLPKMDLSDGPSAIHTQLLKARAAIDRVEELTVILIATKGRTAARLKNARFALQEGEDAAYTARTVAFDQYTTGREREAWARLKLTEKSQLVRECEVEDIRVGATLEAMKMIRWGIDAYRKDADTRLRLMTYERQLER